MDAFTRNIPGTALSTLTSKVVAEVWFTIIDKLDANVPLSIAGNTINYFTGNPISVSPGHYKWTVEFYLQSGGGHELIARQTLTAFNAGGFQFSCGTSTTIAYSYTLGDPIEIKADFSTLSTAGVITVNTITGTLIK